MLTTQLICGGITHFIWQKNLKQSEGNTERIKWRIVTRARPGWLFFRRSRLWWLFFRRSQGPDRDFSTFRWSQSATLTDLRTSPPVQLTCFPKTIIQSAILSDLSDHHEYSRGIDGYIWKCNNVGCEKYKCIVFYQEWLFFLQNLRCHCRNGSIQCICGVNALTRKELAVKLEWIIWRISPPQHFPFFLINLN